MRFRLDRHVYRRADGLSHGPAVWPWWKLVTIKIARCSHDPAHFFWMTPISWNLWIYTRWGARCCNIVERAGVYRRADVDAD